jgi:hypothetical protein
VDLSGVILLPFALNGAQISGKLRPTQVRPRAGTQHHDGQ